MSVLQLRNIKKRFGQLEVIHGVDLDVHEGEFLVFVGPSGCGKSTMLRMIAGLETITEGDLTINGERMNDATPVKRGVAMVFQNYALYPNMSVRQNMAFGLQQAATPKDEIERRVSEAARTLKISDLLGRRPGQLSGGQSQRVAIGRAIVRNPGLFLFDEPLSNLDAELRVHMRVELGRLHARLGRTMIYVTHDQVEAMTMADRIVVFDSGRIAQVGSPLELYNRPGNLFVAGFIGSPRMNFVAGIPQRDGANVRMEACGEILELPADDAACVGRPTTVGVRPEHLHLVETGQGDFSTTVTLAEQLGNETLVYCNFGDADEPWVVRAIGQKFFREGDRVSLRIDWPNAHIFNTDTGERVMVNAVPKSVEERAL